MTPSSHLLLFPFVPFLLLLPGCMEQRTVAQPTPTPQTITAETDQARRFKIQLTLASPEDLKVKEGDTVQPGQLLADRTRDRQQLEAQKTQLLLQIKRLSVPTPGTVPAAPVPSVAALPAPSFLEQVAEVEQAKLKAEEAQRYRDNQQRKLDLIESLPRAEVPEAVIPHEREMLAQRDRALAQAFAAVQLAEARLSKAQKDREYLEYQHSLELSKRAIALQQQELQRQDQRQRQISQDQDREFKLAQLQAQLQTLETQLSQLSAIRSPYRGTIQRIKFEGQRDQSLAVELTLRINAPGPNPSPGSSPSPSPSANRPGEKSESPGAGATPR